MLLISLSDICRLATAFVKDANFWFSPTFFIKVTFALWIHDSRFVSQQKQADGIVVGKKMLLASNFVISNVGSSDVLCSLPHLSVYLSASGNSRSLDII